MAKKPEDPKITALRQAVEIAGGQAALARALGIRQPSVAKWLKNGISPERAIEVEHAVGGEVTRQHLRPDIFGEPDRAAANGRPRPSRAARRPKRLKG